MEGMMLVVVPFLAAGEEVLLVAGSSSKVARVARLVFLMAAMEDRASVLDFKVLTGASTLALVSMVLGMEVSMAAAVVSVPARHMALGVELGCVEGMDIMDWAMEGAMVMLGDMLMREVFGAAMFRLRDLLGEEEVRLELLLRRLHLLRWCRPLLLWRLLFSLGVLQRLLFPLSWFSRVRCRQQELLGWLLFRPHSLQRLCMRQLIRRPKKQTRINVQMLFRWTPIC